jgi:hypothetical protein
MAVPSQRATNPVLGRVTSPDWRQPTTTFVDGDETLAHPRRHQPRWHFISLRLFLFFFYVTYYYDLIHQRDDVKNAIDLPRKIEKRIVQKWAVRSSRVGLTNDSPGFFLLLSDFSFFLSPFVRSFVRSATVAPLSRNTHTHLDVDTHTHTRIIRWQVLTVRPFSSGLDVLTCTSRFFVCRECALSCVCVVCVCAASRGLRPEISYGIWLC